MKYYGFDVKDAKGYLIGVQRLGQLLPEIAPLVIQHYAETEAKYYQTEAAIDWLTYLRQEAEGRFVCITIREPGTRRLIGYLNFYLYPNPLSSDAMLAREEGMYLIPDARGLKLASAMLEYAEEVMSKLGAKYIQITSKEPVGSTPLSDFAAGRGYKAVAIMYSKPLGD